MSNPLVRYQLEGHMGVIYIDTPPNNPLSRPVCKGVIEALGNSVGDSSLIVLILRQEIPTRVAESDKSVKSPDLPEVILALENHPKPVLAALHGVVLGGELEFALAAHFRCATADTELGLPGIKLGLIPGNGGTQRLPRLVGVPAALDIMLSGRTISAVRGQELGLIDTLLEDDKFETSARKYALQLLGKQVAPRPTGHILPSSDVDTDFFDNYRDSVALKYRGQLVPGYLVELAEKATQLPIDQGLALEQSRFIECCNSPQSAALHHVNIAEHTSTKISDISANIPGRPVNNAAVVGAGTMGIGIAMNFATGGIPVTLLETSREALERGLDTIRRNYESSQKRGRFTAEQIEKSLNLIHGTIDYHDIANADVVIEAVFENMAVKKEVFRKLDMTCKPDCILATNTSYLDVNEIANATARPTRVVGAHFFSPANVMKLLEVVRGEHTAPDVVATFITLANNIGKIPVLVGVCHGFVGNRMLKGYARQAQLLLLEGASPNQLDNTIQNWGMAMGPLAMSDLTGLDVGYKSRRDRGIESKSQLESALADTLVEMERLGQKSGAGYYQYDTGTRRRRDDPEVESVIRGLGRQWKVAQRPLNNAEIIDRLILPLVNEGAAILEEGIASRPSDIDVVYVNGYGFPKWRGGPMYYADTVGLNTIISRLHALRDVTGDPCWEPTPLLLQLASRGDTLASLN